MDISKTKKRHRQVKATYKTRNTGTGNEMGGMRGTRGEIYIPGNNTKIFGEFL